MVASDSLRSVSGDLDGSYFLCGLHHCAGDFRRNMRGGILRTKLPPLPKLNGIKATRVDVEDLALADAILTFGLRSAKSGAS